MKKKKPVSLFNWLNGMILVLFAAVMLIPFLNIIAKSLSRDVYVLANEVFLLPKGLNAEAYKFVVLKPQFTYSFVNSLIVTTGGTLLSMLLSVVTAYPLSRRYLPGKGKLMFLYVFTMFFGGGMIPTYLVVQGLGLTNTLWSLVLPVVIVPYNLILLKSFFSEIPDSIEESARMDGASYTRILFQIFVPISLPSIATITMFYAVGYWNNYFNALIYIQNRRLYPLQLYLRDVIVSNADVVQLMNEMEHSTPESIKAATIVASMVPILLVYPLLQRYFVKGIIVGAVKG